jgi:hypothetical protein
MGEQSRPKLLHDRKIRFRQPLIDTLPGRARIDHERRFVTLPGSVGSTRPVYLCQLNHPRDKHPTDDLVGCESMLHYCIVEFLSLALLSECSRAFLAPHRIRQSHGVACQRQPLFLAAASSNKNVEDNDDDDDGVEIDWEALSAELVSEDEDDGLNDGEWLPDRELARQRNERARVYVEKVQHAAKVEKTPSEKRSAQPSTTTTKERASPYTDEEEDVIAAMGGKTHHPQRKREQGFLGDSTLHEIATDYSVPISYLADVLCLWGVPIPIDTHERLGDLVTGEQAFAILEAVNSLDVSALHDRYSNTNLQQLCYEWDIELQQAFELAMKEGWSLPFGVQTCLRVEQENELLRVLGVQGQLEISDYDYDDDY